MGNDGMWNDGMWNDGMWNDGMWNDGTESQVRVRVDLELCVGHGRCYALAPDVFAPDDFGHCELLVTEVDGALAEQARIGAENCPERAIFLED